MRQERYQNVEEEIELKELLAILLAKKTFIVKWTAVVAAIILLGSVAMYFINPPINHYKAVVEITLEPVEMEESVEYPLQLEVLSALPKSDIVANAVKKEFDLSNEATEIQTHTEITLQPESDSLLIFYENQSGDEAVRIADGLADQVVRYVEGSMSTGSVMITRPAVLSTEVVQVRRPVNFVLNTVIGIVLGLMGTIFLVFFMNYINDRIKTTEDVEKRLGVRVLGAIPEFDNKDSK